MTGTAGPLSKHGPRSLRRAMLEATMHAPRHPASHDRHPATKRRLGKPRGAKVAQVDVARRLTEAIRHMLTRNQPVAAAGAADRLAARRPPWTCATAAKTLPCRRSSRRGAHRAMRAARHPPPARSP